MKRSFVFLNFKSDDIPAALIVFDKIVSSQPDFKKTWLLHSIEEPELQDQAFVVKRTKDGDSGMLHNTVLLPEQENLSITSIGGKGKEFWVNGVNYENNPQKNRPDPRNERGEWRVELSPKQPAAEDYFLNVIQVSDNQCKKLHNVQLIKGSQMTGAVINNRIVTFSNTGNTVTGQATLEVKEKGTFRFILTDMKPGTWQVKKDGKVLIPYQYVSAEDGILSFEGGQGHYEFLR